MYTKQIPMAERYCCKLLGRYGKECTKAHCGEDRTYYFKLRGILYDTREHIDTLSLNTKKQLDKTRLE